MMAGRKSDLRSFVCGWFRIVALLVMLGGTSARAQFYNGSNMSFGKNRVQWSNFYWQYLELDKFDVYFYQNGDELANYVSSYAHEQIPFFENRIGTKFQRRIQFIVFNSMGDLKQSNINLADDDNYNIGGSTQVLNYKVLLYFDGNYVDFEQQIREGLSRLLVQQIVGGSASIGSQMLNSLSDDTPEWFGEGLASYLSSDWNSLNDNRLRNGIATGKYKKINRLQSVDARVAGHSFWMFIEERYGKQAFTNIVKLIRVTGSATKALKMGTGLKFRALMKEWYSFYEERYKLINNNVPTDELSLRYRNYRSFSQPRLSPDGSRLAYVSNDNGLIKFWLKDLGTGKQKLLFKAGYRSDMLVDSSYPLLAWNPYGNVLSAVVEVKGKIMLYMFDLEENTNDEIFLFEFQKVTSVAYSSNGRKLVLAATKKGKPDIFVYDLISNRSEQITCDFYTDCNPVFASDDKMIVFASNRPTDTLKVTPQPVTQSDVFNLFAYDLKTKNLVLTNITNQRISTSACPTTLEDGTLCFLNDSSGFFNLYEARFDSAISFVDTIVHYSRFARVSQLTDFGNSIIDYTYNSSTNEFVMLIDDGRGERLYTFEKPRKGYVPKLTQITPYAQKRILGFFSSRQPEETNIEKRRFVSAYRPAERVADSIKSFNFLTAHRGDRNTLHDRRLKGMNPTDSIAPEQRVYYTEFFYDKLTSQLDFTYINYNYQPFAGGGSPIFLNSNYNIYLGTTLKDLMENKKINAGVKLNSSLRNNEYAISFSDLTRKIDRQITVHRVVIDNSDDYYTRTFSNEVYYMFSYPFSEILSARATAIYRNNQRVYLSTSDYALQHGDQFDHWGGLRAELVYDNSQSLGTNLHCGARGKVFGEYYQTISRNTQNLFVVGFDYRNYQRIHRNFIWANRVAASSSFGQSKLIYYMGGEDGWLLPSFNDKTPIDYTQNYVYQTLATNMRGFSQNIRNGNSFVVINSELRLPVFSYFCSMPLKSKFLRDFQIVAFGDVGTAWTGWNPYDKTNSLYTSYIQDGSLDISVTLQKEPIVAGAGFGLRTTLFGYFIRGDVAWGFEDGHRNDKPVYYFSLSLDF